MLRERPQLRVRDDVEHLFVAPHIMFERRDIQIADKNCGLFCWLVFRAPCRHMVEKSELMREFFILVRIGNIAARRHIEIMN